MRRTTERFIAWFIVLAALAVVGGITFWVWTQKDIGSTRGETNGVFISDTLAIRVRMSLRKGYDAVMAGENTEERQ